MKRLTVILVAALLATAAFAQVFSHMSWEFPRDDGPTLYIEVYPNGKLYLYEEDAQSGYKKFVGVRNLRCE